MTFQVEGIREDEMEGKASDRHTPILPNICSINKYSCTPQV